MGHYLHGSSKLDSKALDQALVREKKQSSAIDFLLLEHIRVLLAVRGGLEVVDNLIDFPRANVRRETYENRIRTQHV